MYVCIHTHTYGILQKGIADLGEKNEKKKKNFVENTDLQSKSVSIDSILLSRKEENSY